MSSRDRRKTDFWGYDQHERSVLDVVDEEQWQDELEWALTESLGYARVVSDVKGPVGARHWWHKSFTDHFEAMLNELLHKPLDLCTVTEKTQDTEQATLSHVTDGEKPREVDTDSSQSEGQR